MSSFIVFYRPNSVAIKGRHASDQFTQLLFDSGYTFSVPLDGNVSVEVVVMRKKLTQ